MMLDKLAEMLRQANESGAVRMLAANAAVSWGTSSLTDMAAMAEQRVQAAGQELGMLNEAIEAHRAVLQMATDTSKQARGTLRQRVIAEILAGDYDETVQRRCEAPALDTDANTPIGAAFRRGWNAHQDHMASIGFGFERTDPSAEPGSFEPSGDEEADAIELDDEEAAIRPRCDD